MFERGLVIRLGAKFGRVQPDLGREPLEFYLQDGFHFEIHGRNVVFHQPLKNFSGNRIVFTIHPEDPKRVHQWGMEREYDKVLAEIQSRAK